jgi:hypothetical protein
MGADTNHDRREIRRACLRCNRHLACRMVRERDRQCRSTQYWAAHSKIVFGASVMGIAEYLTADIRACQRTGRWLDRSASHARYYTLIEAHHTVYA